MILSIIFTETVDALGLSIASALFYLVFEVRFRLLTIIVTPQLQAFPLPLDILISKPEIYCKEFLQLQAKGILDCLSRRTNNAVALARTKLFQILFCPFQCCCFSLNWLALECDCLATADSPPLKTVFVVSDPKEKAVVESHSVFVVVEKKKKL